MPFALADRLGEPVVLLDPVGSPGRLVELDEHGALAWDALAWRRRRSGVGRRGSGGAPPRRRRAPGRRVAELQDIGACSRGGAVAIACSGRRETVGSAPQAAADNAMANAMATRTAATLHDWDAVRFISAVTSRDEQATW